jgi:hypothetical protein
MFAGGMSTFFSFLQTMIVIFSNQVTLVKTLLLLPPHGTLV